MKHNINGIGELSFFNPTKQIFDVETVRANQINRFAKMRKDLTPEAIEAKFPLEKTALEVRIKFPFKCSPAAEEKLRAIESEMEGKWLYPDYYARPPAASGQPWKPLYGWMSPGKFLTADQIAIEERFAAEMVKILGEGPMGVVLDSIQGQFSHSGVTCELLHESNESEDDRELWLELFFYMPLGESIRTPEQFLTLIAKKANQALAAAGF